MTTTCYRMPAEWETQQAVLLAWPHAMTDWVAYLDEIQETVTALIAAIARFEDVYVIAPHADEVLHHLTCRLSKQHMRRVHVLIAPTNDTWVRDYGPVTLLPAADCRKDEPNRLLDFCFNAWGEKFAYEKDNAVNAHLFKSGMLRSVYEPHLDFVLEGGSIETDGRGTVFTTSSCLLAPHRNQPLTQRQLTYALKRRLHAQRVVWLHHGHLIGDDTDGHIDTIVRCAPEDTLVYVSCREADDAHFADFLALERELLRLRTPQGKSYRLLPLPMPEAVMFDGERLPATYANFLVVNDAVICPTYGQAENDALAMQVLQKAFPERQVVGVDSTVIIRQHGSIHCMTMQLY